MRIQISDPRLMRDLLDFLRRAECIAEQASRDIFDVFVPRALDERQAREEVKVYLMTWMARHAGARAEFVQSAATPSAIPFSQGG